MRPLTGAQRRGQLAAAWTIGIVAAVAVVGGLLVTFVYPLGVYYGGPGMILGFLAGGIAIAVGIASKRAPPA